MRTVAIIGGGASGMMAALTAAEDKNNRVLIFERQQRVGRKLLATGNGRCNLTNTGASVEHYHGADPEFVRPALQAFGPQETLAFFRSLGLVTTEEYGGRVYPFSNSANSVADVLRYAMEQRGVELKAACPAREIRRTETGFEVLTDEGVIPAHKLIVACGGAAGAKLGGVKDGYELLRPLGHKHNRLSPVLVPVFTEPEYPRALKGIRADVVLTLTAGSRLLGESRGELQFTENGISGPAVFDLTGRLPQAGDKAVFHIDLTAGQAELFRAMLRERARLMPNAEAPEVLTGMLHNRLGRMAAKRSGIVPTRTVGELTEGELNRLLETITDFSLKVTGTAGFDAAQVTGGGIQTSAVDPHTMQSTQVPGLYIIGELLDVDGDCGGFNLQWAWSCGRLAGRLLP